MHSSLNFGRKYWNWNVSYYYLKHVVCRDANLDLILMNLIMYWIIGVCIDTYGLFSEIDELSIVNHKFVIHLFVCKSSWFIDSWKEEIPSFKMVPCLWKSVKNWDHRWYLNFNNFRILFYLFVWQKRCYKNDITKITSYTWRRVFANMKKDVADTSNLGLTVYFVQFFVIFYWMYCDFCIRLI